METIMASSMTVGRTYCGTAQCPPELDGIAFTVKAVESHVETDEDGSKIDLIYAVIEHAGHYGDAHLYFSPGDLVLF